MWRELSWIIPEDIYTNYNCVVTIIGKENSLVYKTFFVQEMLKRGYIASNAFYTTYAHSEEIIKEYLEHVDEVFRMIAEINGRNETVESHLEGLICHSGFGRLN